MVVLWSIVPLLCSSVLALSSRLVVLLRIRTGIGDVDWVAKVKWVVLKESSLLDNMEDFPGPLLSSFTFRGLSELVDLDVVG